MPDGAGVIWLMWNVELSDQAMNTVRRAIRQLREAFPEAAWGSPKHRWLYLPTVWIEVALGCAQCECGHQDLRPPNLSASCAGSASRVR